MSLVWGPGRPVGASGERMPTERTWPKAKPTGDSVRHLLIVAEDQLDLCDYLTRQFSEVGSVEVLLDRRRGERRWRVRPCEPDRRRADRRVQPGSYPRPDGFVIIGRQTN